MPLETTYHVRTNWSSPTSFRSGMPSMESVDDGLKDSFFENDSLGRREMALNNRIAQFEEIVRQTKLEMAERQSRIEHQGRQLDERAERLDEQEERLRVLSDELDAREKAITQRAASLSGGAAPAVHSRERVEPACSSPREWEDFQSRTNEVLEKIRREKRELEALLAQIH